MRPIEKPIFVFGAGAQKAGTTWLHRYLNKNSHVNMGFAKEYHVWDVKFDQRLFGSFEATRKKWEPASNALRRGMQNIDGLYESYFADLIDDTTRITGDISPTYCALNADNFGEIKSRLLAAGFSVRVVFLLRDPTDRCWSAVRMKASRTRDNGGKMSDQVTIDKFEETFGSEQFEVRTRYDRAIENLRAAFEPEELHIGIFEEMFTEENLGDLSRFLSVDFDKEFVKEKPNVSHEIPLPIEIRRECFDYYRETYEYCYTNFPQTKELWWSPPAKASR